MKFIYLAIAVMFFCGLSYKGPETELMERLNRERTAADVAPLSIDWEVARLARYKVEDMQQLGFLGHVSPVYGTPEDMMRRFEIPFCALGITVAKGQECVQEVMSAWLSSPLHREVLLDTRFSHAGVGFTRNEDDIPYWAILFFTSSAK